MQSIRELAIVEPKNAIGPFLDSMRDAAPDPGTVVKGLFIPAQMAVKSSLMVEFIMDISPRSRWWEMIRPYHEEGPYAET